MRKTVFTFFVAFLVLLGASVNAQTKSSEKSQEHSLLKAPNVKSSTNSGHVSINSLNLPKGTFADAYCGNTTDLTYNTIDIATGTVTGIGTIGDDPFPMSEEFDGTTIFRVYNDGTYGTVDNAGVYTAVGTFSGVAGTPTGLAYDWDNDVMYAMVLTAANLPQLCTVDMTTGVMTLVGTGTFGMIIGIDFANDGFLYGPALDDDNLYKIDPATGACTIVGPAGIDLNYGQDVSYDRLEERLYTVSSGAIFAYGYYDLTTGAFVQILDMAGDQYATFVIAREPDLTLAEIIDFSIPQQTGPAVIDDVNHTVAVEVGFGTDVTALVADFTLSYAATAAVSATPQVSGVTPNDFTAPVTYTVTSGDLSVNQDWTVTVTIAPIFTETDILTFSFDEQTGPAVIDAVNHTVAIEVAYGTDVTGLVADYTLSYGATATIAAVPQVSGVTANDYTADVVYNILAEDAVTNQDWTVTVTIEVIPVGEMCVTAFNYGTINDPAQAGSIVASGAYWYSVTFPNPVENVIFSLCTGTDYDSMLEIWDDCSDAAYLYYNDDACDVQSEITVAAMDAGTYYVKVLGYGTSFGNYSLNITGTLLLGPQVETLLPADLSTDVALDATVSVTFTGNITEVDLTGITITPDPLNVTATIVDNVLTIAHDDFDFNTVYTVLVPAGAVTDGVDNLANDITWSFTTVLDPLACNDPSDIIISDITTNEATVSWTENGAGTEWIVLYGPTGFDPMTEGDQVTVTPDPTTTLIELTDDTEYDVYVQAICGVETSGWAGPVTFSTLIYCDPIVTLPFSEDFEAGVFPPACWNVINTHPSENWHQGVPDVGFAAEVTYLDAVMMDEWLISPTFDLSAISGELHVSFSFYTSYYWLVDFTDGADIMLKVSTDGGATWTELWNEEDFGVFENFTWYSATIPFSAYAGESNVKIAFHYLGNDGAQTMIDNIVIDLGTEVETDVTNAVSIYPNPSNDLVNIAVTENSIVSVVDIAGRNIATFNVNANEEVNFTQSAGMYFVKVESNGKVYTQKLVIE